MADAGLPPLACPLCRGEGTPLFLVPSVGTTPLSLVRLARAIVPRRPVHAFAYAGLEDERPPHATFEAMAEAYVTELVALAPDGEVHLGGHCLGGAVALEMAQQLASRGRSVSRLVMMDAVAPRLVDDGVAHDPQRRKKLDALPPAVREILLGVADRTHASANMLEPGVAERLGDLVGRHLDAAFAYRARRCDVPIVILVTDGDEDASGGRWARIAGAGVVRHAIPGDSFSMLHAPHVDAVGRVLGRALDDRA
jgi:thioesterase domain-containing protein